MPWPAVTPPAAGEPRPGSGVLWYVPRLSLGPAAPNRRGAIFSRGLSAEADNGRTAGGDRREAPGGGLAAALPLSALLWGAVAAVLLPAIGHAI